MISKDADTEKVLIQIDRTSTSIDYESGETILETARRAMLQPPFNCRRGNCGTCRALIERGTATMRKNNYLTPTNIRDGWILTCQAKPTSVEISVNYNARTLVPGLRRLLRAIDVNSTGRLRLFFNRSRARRHI
jgi:ferredoxin